jgi:hypothetical protein
VQSLKRKAHKTAHASARTHTTINCLSANTHKVLMLLQPDGRYESTIKALHSITGSGVQTRKRSETDRLSHSISSTGLPGCQASR